MADYNIQFVIRALDNASSVLEQERRTLQQMSASTQTSARDHRRATDTMAEGNRRLSSSNSDAEFSFGELDRSIKNLVTGFGAYFIVQKGLELVNLGEEVHDVTVQFDAYAESLDNTTDLLPKLREATLGGASDMELMAASAKLASLKLATTDDDLERFIGMTYRLTGSTEQVGNLAMALTNMSYLRLDAFGLSADLARKRVAELKDELPGIADTEAFTRAVIEQMEEKIGDVGDTLDEQLTNVDRFKVGWANAWDEIALKASEGANAVLGAINEIMAEPDTDPSGGVLADRLTGNEEAFREHLALLVDAWDIGVGMTIDEAMTLDKNLRGLTEQERALLEELVIAHQEFSALGGGQPSLGSSSALREATALARQQAAREQARQNSIQFLSRFNPYEVEAGAMEMMAEYGRQAMMDAERRNRLLQESSTLITDISDEYWNISDAAIEIDGVDIVTPDQAERIGTMVEQYDLLVERARVLHENGIISDDQLGALESAQQRTQQMAESMERGASALEEMSTSDFFGTESGGLLGQLGDEVVQAARDAGISDADLQAFQDALNLESGRATDDSLRWQNEVIPLIVATMDTNSSEAALAALQQYILETGTERFGAEQGAFLAGVDWLPTQDEIDPLQVAALDISANMTTSAEQSASMNESLIDVNSLSGKISTTSGEIANHWKTLTSGVQRIQADIEIRQIHGTPWEQFLAGQMTNITRNRGGSAPGQDARVE